MASTRTLILMRHATAGQGGYRDHDRQLTAEGSRDAAAAGEWMRRSLPTVDAVLCSTAVRTRQTLAATGVGAPVRFSAELYGGGVGDILEQIALQPESVGTVLVVGHAPSIPATAYELATVAALGRDESSADDPRLDGLRHFSACALAVLGTEADWVEIADRGADLLTVRHPDG